MKLNIRTFIAIFCFLTTLSVFAQNNLNSTLSSQAEKCKSAILHKQLLLSDPAYAARMQANEIKIQQIINYPAKTGGIYIIPVVVHILNKGEAIGVGTNISDAQINSAIANLNNCYGGASPYSTDIQVQFQLAVRDPFCNATTGIVRVNASGVSDYNTQGITSANETTIKAISKWPNSEYYNIWIVSEIDNNGGGAGTQGYAYFPGAGSTYDGAVILFNSFGYDPTNSLGYNLKTYTNYNSTANHELGHAFDLYHTFEGDDAGCPVNTDCTMQGDLCCDTEAHQRVDGDCGDTGASCTGQSLTNVVQNIMSYSSDYCQTKFSLDQKDRIRAAISGTRASLLTSPGLLAVTGSSPSVAKACSPQSITLTGNTGMGVYSLTIGSTSYASSGTVADGGFRNNWCSNFSLTPNTLYSITVANGTINNEKVRVFIDYNNDGDFEDSGETVYNDNTGALTHTGSFTTSASPTTGQPIWIRVISDFVNYTISNSCFVPTYGQVEDFSVIFSSGCTTPTITGSTPGSRCGTGTVSLGATASAGTLNWYAASSGGTSLGAGTSFTTPSISSTTNYYVDATDLSCTSARTAVIATVNTLPSITGTAPGSHCGTGAVTLGANASSGTLNWYAASSGGASLGTGNSYITSSISTTTTYYVDATNGGCTSSRTGVIASINSMPTITGTTPGSRCGTGTVSLGATASAGTLNWYAASSGGASLGTGTSFSTPSISTTTTYYVDATNGSCISSRTAVIATINASPTITGTTPGSRCGTGSVSLGATASAGTLNWYAASSGGASLGTGTSFSTPSISTTTTYYVDATNGGCTSSRTGVIASINSMPTITGTTPGSRCGTGMVSLGATASAGTLNWYAASSGGASLGTGTFFSTPSISSTTTYYVDATNGSCISSRTAVIATINASPTITGTTPGSRCGTGIVSLGATASAGTLNWYAASSGGASLGTGTSFSTPSISTTTTYYVDVTNGGCTSSRTAVIATINVLPSLSSTMAQSTCTDNDGSINLIVSGGTPAYTYSWSNGATTEDISGLSQGSYTVTVTDSKTCSAQHIKAVTQNCNSLVTKIRTADCGITLATLNQLIYCDAVTGAVAYEWEFVSIASSVSFINTSQCAFNPNWIIGIEYNKTYDVRVRAKVGSLWGNFGAVCQITTPSSIPNTKVRAADCGITLAALNQVVYCDGVPGAVNFEWEFVNTSSSFGYTKTNTSQCAFNPAWIIGIEYNKTYDVRVRAKVGTAWGTFATVCQINTPSSIPDTKVRALDCGRVLSSLTQLIYCDAVPGAVNYEWEFVNTSSSFSYTKTNTSQCAFNPAWIIGIQYNKTYDVRVRAKVGTQWGNFATVCQITTPSAPALAGGGNNELRTPAETSNPNTSLINSISVYPNPSDGDGFNISINSLPETVYDLMITVYDIYGKTVCLEMFSGKSNGAIVKLNSDEHLAKGVYIVNVNVNGQSINQKLIIK